MNTLISSHIPAFSDATYHLLMPKQSEDCDRLDAMQNKETIRLAKLGDGLYLFASNQVSSTIKELKKSAGLTGKLGCCDLPNYQEF
jgi:hypothetical protein